MDPVSYEGNRRPLTLGHLFDTIGRKRMIAVTYALSGILLAASGVLFQAGQLTAVTQTLLWCVIFFIASAAASSAYLTVSEIFPLPMRAQAIAFFFSLAQLFGGVVAPALFGLLIATRERAVLAMGYHTGGLLMLLGAFVAWRIGLDAEGKSLEQLAPTTRSNVE